MREKNFRHEKNENEYLNERTDAEEINYFKISKNKSLRSRKY